MGNLESYEMDNTDKYHKQGCTARTRCKTDNISCELGTTWEHKILKTQVCLKLLKNEHHFITEAVPNDRDDRRIDIVDISSNDPVEIEVEVSGDDKEDCDVIVRKENVKTQSPDGKKLWDKL